MSSRVGYPTYVICLVLLLTAPRNGQSFTVGTSFQFRRTPSSKCLAPGIVNPSRYTLQRRATVASPGNETFVAGGEEEGNYNKTQTAFPQYKKNGQGSYSTRKRVESSGKTYYVTYELNEALNRLAEQAGDSRQPVVERAMACEKLWKEYRLLPKDDNTNINDTFNDGGTKKCHSDIVSFNTVLKAWSKAAQVLAEHHEDRNHEHLLDANIPIYTARECAAHALELLDQQEEAARRSKKRDAGKGNPVAWPDVQSYNTCMDAWAKSGVDESTTQLETLLLRLQKSGTMEPDIISYNALVDAYAVSNSEDRLEKLRRIWDHMEATPSLLPTSRTTNSILHGYRRMMKDQPSCLNPRQIQIYTELAWEAMEKFQALKKRYQEIGRPEDELDVVTYTTAMDVWSKLGTLEGARNAEALFQELKATINEGSGMSNCTRPNSYSYTTLISAWARVADNKDEACERVSRLVDELTTDSTPESLSHHPFTAALRCWSRGKVPGKAVKALNTLKKMKELAKNSPHVAPNILTYHAALECCIKIVDTDPSQQTAALKIAFAILQSMTKDGLTPNQLTYSKLLRCVEALLPVGSERNQVAKAAFEKALAAGMADATVVASFRKAADTNVVLDSVVGEISDQNGYVDLSRIPLSWKRNTMAK